MAVTAPTLPPARWWRALEDKKVECQLCPRHCHIPAGSRGFCFVRANVDGHLELTTYGRSSGFCIDPVEKKPLNHFLPGTPILSFGTAGCNLGCKFCQNWDISKSREMDTIAQLALPEAIVEAAVRSGCRSLAFTYNDPVIWAEYAIDVAKAAHARGLKTVAVTAGYISPEARREFYDHMDAANVDLKAFTDSFYSRLCQVKLDPILDTLKYLKRETKVWFELTTLIIPGENDSPDETKAMCAWIVENLGPDVPLHFSAFHPDFKMRDKPPTPLATLVRAREIACAAGIRYAYVGNVNDVENQSTYCHGCGKMLIRRDWYDLSGYHLRRNACEFCGTIIPGVFDDQGPGNWGNKRQAISVTSNPSSFVRMTSSMSNNESIAPTSAAASGTLSPKPAGPQIEFTPAQDQELLKYARVMVESATNPRVFIGAKLPEELAQAPAYGMFVSLHRGQQLRACKGQWSHGISGGMGPLGPLLNAVARDAATNDPRFPRIAPHETPFLTLEISLMHSPQVMTARGAARLGGVQVGTHGLVIAHPQGQGLLLPHVATEQGWDARQFLENVCAKAGLPPQTWMDDRAQLMTFCARKIEDPAPAHELDLAKIGSGGLSRILTYVHLLLSGKANSPGAVGMPLPAQAPLLYEKHAEELGIFLQTPSGVTGAAIRPNDSLIGLATAAAQYLIKDFAQRGRSEQVQHMIVLHRPQLLFAADSPARHGHLTACAIHGRVDDRFSLVIPRANVNSDPIPQVLNAMNVTREQWLEDRQGRIQITAFNVFHCRNHELTESVNVLPPVTRAVVRPAFRAGAFYPADSGLMRAEVEGHLRAGGFGTTAPQTYRAIMLPHAGWLYCGGTMGKTLAGVKLPRTVIVVGPRHTGLGANNSAASHSAWQIPGANIPVVTGLAQRLSRVPGFAYETETHRQEHSIEVILPFLHHLRPDLQIVPIVLGQCDGPTLTAFARELAGVLSEARGRGEEVPLVVISSDMNHFAAEAENRRRDMLAIDAMLTGDPRRLYETCTGNEISMCGLIPAVAVMQALQVETPVIQPRLVDYSNSAAASGDTSRVVGYAGVVIP